MSGNPARRARYRFRRECRPPSRGGWRGGRREVRSRSRRRPRRSARQARAPAPRRLRVTRSSSNCPRQVWSPSPCCDPAGRSLSSGHYDHTGFRTGQPSRADRKWQAASMLQAIRSRAGSFIVKALFGLLILTFGVWGIGDIFRNRGTDTAVATVGDQSIRAEDLQTALRRALDQMSARFGSAIDMQQAKKLGLVDETLNQLIDRSLVDQEVARLQLNVSDELIRNVI